MSNLPEYFKAKTSPEQIFVEYSRAKAWNTGLGHRGLYEQVKLNERFFSGDQWYGVKAPNIDKPVLNFLNRTVMYEIALIVSNNIGVSVTHMNDDESEEGQAIAKFLEKSVDDVIEDNNLHSQLRENLRDCAVDGDCCLYAFWDAEAEKVMVEQVPNTSVLFGNPNVDKVQTQPYIIIEQARDLKEVRYQAYKAGVQNWESIKADNENAWRQNDQEESNNARTCTVLKKFWKDLETGHIWFCEVTSTVTLREPVDTELELYPIAWMNWEKVKDCYHGKAIVTGVIDNQIAVNRTMASALWHIRQQGFGKQLYDISKFPNGMSNMPGQSIGVAPGGLDNNPVVNIDTAKMDSNVMDVMDKVVSLTRDFMGVNDVVLGNISPNNTSAIVAVQKSTAAPLEMQRLNFFQFVEDIVRVIINLMTCNFGLKEVRTYSTTQDPVTGMEYDGESVFMINFDEMNYSDLKLKVDIGEAAYWSELMQLQTMDSLYDRQLIPDPVTYLESIPDKYLPKKAEIVESFKRMQAQQTGQSTVEEAEEMPQPNTENQRAENFVAGREEMVDELQSL